MATAYTKRWRHVNGNIKQLIGNVVFTGNYTQDGLGSTITNSQLGVKRILAIQPCGLAKSTDLATANEVSVTVNAAGSSAEITFYENAAAGSPSAEKTDAEAFITGCNLDVVVHGY
jgi:hypothetical protein